MMTENLMSTAEKICNIAGNKGASETLAYLVETKEISNRFARNHITQNVIRVGSILKIAIAIGRKLAAFSGSLPNDPTRIAHLITKLTSMVRVANEDTDFPGSIAGKITYPETAGLTPRRNQIVDPEDVKNLVETVICTASQQKEVKAVSGNITFTAETRAFASSHQITNQYQTSYFKVTISTIAKKHGNEGQATRRLALRSLKSKPLEITAEDMAITAILNTRPKKIDVDTYKAILDPMALAEIIYLLGIVATGSKIHQYSSFLLDIEQKMVFDEEFTLLSDTHNSENIIARPFDDEGTPTKTFLIFENGILKNIGYDQRSAKKDGKESNGCAAIILGKKKVNFPATRVMTTSATKEDLIRKMKSGILIKNLFYNTFVDIRKEIASFLTKEGIFVIKNGVP